MEIENEQNEQVTVSENHDDRHFPKARITLISIWYQYNFFA